MDGNAFYRCCGFRQFIAAYCLVSPAVGGSRVVYFIARSIFFGEKNTLYGGVGTCRQVAVCPVSRCRC
ncbi:hypothetical protein Barb4_04428 [Bacteroidales bacterium Barb4]|nr:hypothetical protein Barb4_04428 [Bacteroidales bacterium Barb4]